MVPGSLQIQSIQVHSHLPQSGVRNKHIPDIVDDRPIFLLGHRPGQPSEQLIHHLWIEQIGMEKHIAESNLRFYSAIFPNERIFGDEQRMAESERRCCKLDFESGVYIFLVARVRPDFLLVGVWPQQHRQIVPECYFLDQACHVILGCLINLLIAQEWLLQDDHLAHAVVFPHEDGVVAGEENILIGSDIACIVQSMFIALHERQHVVLSNLHLAHLEGSQPISNLFGRSVDLAGIVPSGYAVHLIPDSGIRHGDRPFERDSLGAVAFQIHERVAFGNMDRHSFIAVSFRQTKIMVEELAPKHKRRSDVIRVSLNHLPNATQGIACLAWRGIITHRRCVAIFVEGWGVAGQPGVSRIVRGMLSVIR